MVLLLCLPLCGCFTTIAVVATRHDHAAVVSDVDCSAGTTFDPAQCSATARGARAAEHAREQDGSGHRSRAKSVLVGVVLDVAVLTTMVFASRWNESPDNPDYNPPTATSGGLDFGGCLFCGF
jgi:hypothetical protein